ncbi:hypothetical protein ROLI_041760 [Roseobacter fucihabitans]|uniref:Secreted protein n=1 Tax=Roseobacter fucihabitans TaxID=1537242 RepID=A0ABZ2C0D4_9RHOB|nr:hypothetical protein [Roseobacter litoralis]
MSPADQLLILTRATWTTAVFAPSTALPNFAHAAMSMGFLRDTLLGNEKSIGLLWGRAPSAADGCARHVPSAAHSHQMSNVFAFSQDEK